MRLVRLILTIFGLSCLNLLLCLNGVGCSRDAEVKRDAIVTNRLWRIWHALQASQGEADRFPASLARLETTAVEGIEFTCPGTGSQPGPLKTVEEWGDYIYVGGMSDDIPGGTLLMSPPENHDGRYGYVMLAAGAIRQVSPALARRLVKEPWLTDSNATREAINYMKQGLSVRIPKRLRPFYQP